MTISLRIFFPVICFLALFQCGLAEDHWSKQWFYEGELNRRQFHPQDFSDKNDPTILSVSQLWEGKNEAILNDPLEEDILSEQVVDGIRHKEFFFTSRTVADGKVRVYAKYAAKQGAQNLPAVLHIHGGGQTLNEQWVDYFAKQGYAVLSFDFCGEWNNRPLFTRYPESLKYGEQRSSTNNVAEGCTEHNSWHEWTYLCRRALTCLAGQQEVDPQRLGIFGISVGGTLSWMVAGTDTRVKAAVPLYGAGYDYEYRNYPYYQFKKYDPRTEVKRYLHAITAEACAPFITAPLLFLNSSNDFHGQMDWACKTYDALPVTTIRRMSVVASYNHHISPDQDQNLILWMNAHLKKQGVFPLNPRLTITKGDGDSAKIVLNADSSQEIEYVKIFAALEDTEAFTRYWQETEIQSEGNGIFSTEPAVLDVAKYLFAYATIKYKAGHHLSSEIVAVIPEEIGIDLATGSRTCVIYDATQREKGWAVLHLPTDPIPPFPFLSALGAGEQGGVYTNLQCPGVVTYRLSDPRFFPPSEQAALKLTFSTSEDKDVIVRLTNQAYSGVGNYIFSQKITPADSSFTITRDQLMKEDKPLDSWSIVPILSIENTSSTTILMQIEWVD